MSNSSLISYSKISPNRTSPRNHTIDTITIHCMAGNLSIESCGNLFAKSSTKASSNYGIGTDGRIALYVEEKDRSWASSNSANDNRAITIEVANDGGAETGWHISDKAYNSLINLLVDICQRNGIKELKWKGDKNLIGQIDKQNMTVHRWFANKACPGDYLYGSHPKIANDVNQRLNKNIPKIQNEEKNIDKPKVIWDRFKAAGFTDIATAAILGNLYDESHLNSNNLQNSFEKKFNMDDTAYTSIVNSKLYPEESFCKDGAGYGLAQWTYWTRKQGLYEYTVKQGFSIDDFERQISYIITEMNGYKGFVANLNAKKNLSDATIIVLTQYEKPADQSAVVKERRTKYAQLYFDKYATNKIQIVDNGSFTVKVNRNDLRIRKGPGTNYEDTKQSTGKGIFTIVELQNGQGSSTGWGLLKSYSKNRNGWISLDYTEKV